MSRIGKKPIAIPKGVKIDVQPGAVEVQGPKGKLRQPLPEGIGFEVNGDQLQAKTLRDDPPAAQAGPLQAEGRSLHRRSPEEEGRQDGGEIASSRQPSASSGERGE